MNLKKTDELAPLVGQILAVIEQARGQVPGLSKNRMPRMSDVTTEVV